MHSKLHDYIHATQRGYASGLCDGTARYFEEYHRVSEHGSIDAAYRAASRRAIGLLATAKRAPRLLDFKKHQLDVACCAERVPASDAGEL